jgi:CBS domain-containing protein
MKTPTVSEVMTPAEELPSIGGKTTLLEAAAALKRSAMNAPVPLLVSVRGEDGLVMGILGMVDLLRGLSPKYADQGFLSDLKGQGLGPGLLEMFVEKYKLFHESMESICQAALTPTVDSLLGPPRKEDAVDAEASLDVAIDLMVLRRRDYLLVTRDGATIGVIDAAGVFDAIHKRLCARAV